MSTSSICQNLPNVSQEPTDPLNGVLSVYIAFQIRERFIAKSHTKICELQQVGQETGNPLACLFKQGAQLVQIMGSWERRSHTTQPSLQGFFDSLLNVKSEYLVGENLWVFHATQSTVVFLGYVKKAPSLLKISHREAFLP